MIVGTRQTLVFRNEQQFLTKYYNIQLVKKLLHIKIYSNLIWKNQNWSH